MAVFAYNKALYLLATGALNLATADMRVALLNASTTADTERSAATLDAFSTLGEITATDYVRKALANESVTQDDGNNRVKFDADNLAWAAIGGAANDTIAAALIYVHVGTDSQNIPFAYVDGFTPLPTNGSGVTMTIDPNGVALFANKA